MRKNKINISNFFFNKTDCRLQLEYVLSNARNYNLIAYIEVAKMDFVEEIDVNPTMINISIRCSSPALIETFSDKVSEILENYLPEAEKVEF